MTQSPDLLLPNRLWRVRRRGDAVDASIQPVAERWRLQLTRKGRMIGEWDFDTRDEALEDGLRRRQEFERAGWTEHW